MNKYILKSQEIELENRLRLTEHKMLELEYSQPNGQTLAELAEQKKRILKDLGSIRVLIYKNLKHV